MDNESIHLNKETGQEKQLVINSSTLGFNLILWTSLMKGELKVWKQFQLSPSHIFLYVIRQSGAMVILWSWPIVLTLYIGTICQWDMPSKSSGSNNFLQIRRQNSPSWLESFANGHKLFKWIKTSYCGWFLRECTKWKDLGLENNEKWTMGKWRKP